MLGVLAFTELNGTHYDFRVPRQTKNARTASGYIAYYRVSSVRQGESGLGLGAQREAVGRLAKLDRLARNVAFISGLMESGVEFIAADMPLANRLTIHILAAVAEHEREMISARTKAGMEAAQREIEANGFRISRRSGKPYSKHGNPRWQECIGKARAARKPAHEVAAEVARHATELRQQGLSLRAIATQLNHANIRRPTGAAWHVSSVQTLLRANGQSTARIPAAQRPDSEPKQLSTETHVQLDSFRAQGKSLRQIAAALNELGLKTTSGAQWHPSSVRTALQR